MKPSYPAIVEYRFQPETMAQVVKVPKDVVNGRSMQLGMEGKEPLLICLDSLLRYAKAYRGRFDGPLSEDYYLGVEWLQAIKGVKNLLNGDGAVAMEDGITTDSKDNGALDSLFWEAIKVAGFKENDI